MESFFGNETPVNWLGVVVSTIVMMVVITLWYSPFLFNKIWVRHSGIRSSDLRRNELRRSYIIFGIMSFVSAYLLGIVAAHASGSVTAILGSVVFIWLFVMMELLNRVLWERDTVALFVLQASRSLVALIAGGAVFLLWS